MGKLSTVDQGEIDKFSAMADDWWDPDGKFKPLHQLNETRLKFIRQRSCRHFGRDDDRLDPFDGLSVLDVGCGGGLISEPMARLGGAVTGLDAAPANIEVARLHAAASGLTIDYRCATAEEEAEAGRQYDLVLALEIIEHVADVGTFLSSLGRVVRPGGALFLSTLNRTAKAYLLAIVGAEYLLRWLPRGTHDWQRFVKPSELTRPLRQNGLKVGALSGLVYNPLADRWHLDERDLDVNYILFAAKDG